MPTIPEFRPGDLLLVVDVQNDFLPGGALAIADGDAILPVLNRAIASARDAGIPIYLSRDWHPREHPSFAPHGGPWPVHCVQDSDGARFHADLEIPFDAVVVTKGTRFDQDQNSAFDQTGLATWLRSQGVRRIVLGGLAQDVCVKLSALEGRQAGFEVTLMLAATRPVSVEGGREALAEMRRAGVEILAG